MFPQELPSLTADYPKRVQRLTRSASKKKLDALVVITDVNRSYLTGFSSSNAVLVLAPGETLLFFTDFRYIEMAKRQIEGAKVHLLGKESANLQAIAKKKKWRRVGYEGMISTLRFEELKKSMPEVDEWVEASDLVSDLRVVKNRVEQTILRRAVHLGDEVYARTIEEVRIGMTEWDVRRILRGHVDRLDADEESFDSIIAAGANSSQCHHHVTHRPLRRGQPLLVDMGVTLGGYHSDMTRTVFLGKASDKMRDIYQIVLEAQLAAIDVVRAGAKCVDIDQAARAVIEKAGYGKRFGHGLGHGVGLEIHEAPSLGAASKDTLRPGMVVTIEPGIYLPGAGGVRIEDCVIVRKDGCEVLTRTPKELTILDL